MKKFTLFFLSMFLVLGTSMAQDKFEVVSVNPSGAVTAVDNILLVFSQEVEVTFPEGGFAVIDEATKSEVVKVANVMQNEWLEKTWVVLEFEKKMVAGKDGKEEEQVQRITTPGSYSFTIPAGMIKSATSGEEFPETTFAFSVVGTFPIVGYSPMESTVLDKIEVKFDTEIDEVKMPANGLFVADYYYTTMVNVKPEVAISEDKKTVTLELETPITTPGSYSMDLYQGIFVGAAGISQGAYLTFEVVDPTPRFITNYNDGDEVKELNGVVFEISFKNVKEVELVGDKLEVFLPGEGAAVAAPLVKEGDKLVATFSENFETPGDYLFYIPEGLFLMDGVPNEEREITVTLVKVDIKDLEIVSITPEAGKVDQLEQIVIQFNQAVQLSFDENWQQISQRIALKCGDKEIPLQYAPDYSSNTSDKLIYLVNGEWTGFEWGGTPVSEDGTYVLDLSSIVVDYSAEQGIDEWGYPTTIWNGKSYKLQGTYTWTIGEAAVEKVVAGEGEQVIYDLLGRRVERIAGAGIYIVGGRKVVVK